MSCGRVSWRRDVLGIFSFNLLFKFGFVSNAGPATFNLWLCNLRFYSGRRNVRRRLGQFVRCTHQKLVPLDLRERPAFGRRGKIGRSLALYREPLNRPARVTAHHVVIRAVIIDHIVLNVDVRHVHCVRDVSDVLRWRIEPIPQNRFADEPNVAEVVIFRPDIEFDIDASTDRPSFIDDLRTTWRQWRPADVVSTGSPRDPCRAPVQIAAWDPDPSVIRQSRPAAIVVRGPAEVFIGDPRPTVVGVSPVAIGIRAPVRIAHGYVRLPAITVAFDLEPVSAGEIVVKEVNRYVGSPRLRKSRLNKSQHC